METQQEVHAKLAEMHLKLVALHTDIASLHTNLAKLSTCENASVAEEFDDSVVEVVEKGKAVTKVQESGVTVIKHKDNPFVQKEWQRRPKKLVLWEKCIEDNGSVEEQLKLKLDWFKYQLTASKRHHNALKKQVSTMSQDDADFALSHLAIKIGEDKIGGFKSLLRELEEGDDNASDNTDTNANEKETQTVKEEIEVVSTEELGFVEKAEGKPKEQSSDTPTVVEPKPKKVEPGTVHIDKIEWHAININEKNEKEGKANFTAKSSVKHGAVITGRIIEPEHEYRESVDHIQAIINYLKINPRIENVETLIMPVDLRSESTFSTESGVDLKQRAKGESSGIFSLKVIMKAPDNA